MSQSELKQTEQQVMEDAKDVGSVGRILAQVESVGLQGLGGATEMRRKLEEHTEVRVVILEHIDANFVKGVDYGKSDPRSDKDTLLKPGAEKVCRLFNTHPRWIRDYDTWEMIGKKPGIIFLLCQIVDNDTGRVIGEGRGAATMGDKSRDANKTIKNAEKCALVDAALYTFMLSEKFTQDGGGLTQATLAELKEKLTEDVSELRMGADSSLTDNRWIHMVIGAFLHKTRIDTTGEMTQLRKAIFEDGLFDLATGERIP